MAVAEGLNSEDGEENWNFEALGRDSTWYVVVIGDCMNDGSLDAENEE